MIYTDNDLISIIADSIIYFLKSQGFIIQRYNAYSTNSVYLKLDFGVSNSIRISDHPGKQHLQYRYNVIVGGDHKFKEDLSHQYPMYFYNDESYCDMLKKIISDKKEKLEKYKRIGYESFMKKNQLTNKYKQGFWKDATLV